MISDEALYERLLRGDMKAFDALYERHATPLFGFIRKQIAAGHEAEDVLHETFMAVLKASAARPSSTRSFRAWLFQVARHLCLNHARSSHRAAHAAQVTARTEAPPPPAPVEQLEQKQTLRQLDAAVSRLPAELAKLFSLRSQGLSYEEMAEVLEVPLGTVKSRMHQMVSLLRQEVVP